MTGETGKMENSPTSYDLFISYHSADSDVVRSLADELHRRGLNSCFVDYKSSVGQNWQQQIREALEKSRYCIVILTDNSTHPSPWVSNEWASIQECSWRRPELSICSLRTGDIAPPPFLRDWKSVRCELDASDVRSAADQIVVLFWNDRHRKETSRTCQDPEAQDRFAEIKRALEGVARESQEQQDE